MRCLGEGCGAFYKRGDYERILGQDAVEMRNRLETRASLKNVKGMTTCPACDFAAFVDVGVHIFDCRSPACLKTLCLKRQGQPHLDISCEDARKQRSKAAAPDAGSSGSGREDLRRKVEEYVSDALIRKCQDCSIPFAKDNGCNEMHCICDNVSCYACKAQYIGHEHWFGRMCKQFESAEIRDERERKDAEKMAIAQVMRENPGSRGES
jgi:TRIAD3 protein (E3 ubiquitin-protein ligase RNF216)